MLVEIPKICYHIVWHFQHLCLEEELMIDHTFNFRVERVSTPAHYLGSILEELGSHQLNLDNAELILENPHIVKYLRKLDTHSDPRQGNDVLKALEEALNVFLDLECYKAHIGFKDINEIRVPYIEIFPYGETDKVIPKSSQEPLLPSNNEPGVGINDECSVKPQFKEMNA